MYEFISENTNNISLVIAVFAGFFAFIKWLDSRNQNLKNQKFEQYMNLVKIISGSKDSGSSVAITEQMAAVWFILEYKHITLKIFDNKNFETIANPTWKDFVLPEVKKVLLEIKSSD